MTLSQSLSLKNTHLSFIGQSPTFVSLQFCLDIYSEPSCCRCCLCVTGWTPLSIWTIYQSDSERCQLPVMLQEFWDAVQASHTQTTWATRFNDLRGMLNNFQCIVPIKSQNKSQEHTSWVLTRTCLPQEATCHNLKGSSWSGDGP